MKALFVNANNDANLGLKAKDSMIEAAVLACRDDDRALAALAIVMWKLADRSDLVDAERAFFDAVLRAGGDWLAAKRTIAEMITTFQSDLPTRSDDDHI